MGRGGAAPPGVLPPSPRGRLSPTAPPELPIGAALTWLAEADPDAVALRVTGPDAASWTRAELDRDANRLARQWAARGVGHDDLVSVVLPNGVDFVLAAMATWKLGATPQPLSPGMSERERDAVLELAEPALVVDGPVEVDAYLDPSPLPPLAASSWKAPTSSGSTGRPKIVRATARATVDPEGRVAAFVPRRAVQLVAGPLFHAAPFVYAMRGLMTGHELVVLPRFDAAAALGAVEEHGVTWAMLVPTMMHRIWRLDPAVREHADVSSLESVLHLGARCPAWLKRAWIEWLGPERVVELYAGTESQGLALVGGAEWLQHPGTVGRPVGGSQFRVVRPDGTECAPGETGEILMRREGGARYRYVGAPETTRDGWHTLGDAGWLDEDGYLFVADRLDDVIVTGGAKVQPADVEAVLEEHPAVRSAVAVPREDEDLGQRVHAVVDVGDVGDVEAPDGRGPGDEQLSQELLAWAAERLDPEKRPRTLELVHEPLRADTGKVRRRDHR